MIIRVIATPAYDAAITPARILAISLIFMFAAPVFYNLLFAINRQGQLIAVGVGAVILNVAMNLYLIPRYSYNGAAVATLISEFVGFIATFLVARRLTSISVDPGFLVRAAAATGAAALAAAVAWNVSPWVALVLGELALFTVALMLGAINRVELRYVLKRAES